MKKDYESTLKTLESYKKDMDISCKTAIETAICVLKERKMPHYDSYSSQKIIVDDPDDLMLKIYLLVIMMKESNAHGKFTDLEIAEIILLFTYKFALQVADGKPYPLTIIASE